jgi:hypothetical protein
MNKKELNEKIVKYYSLNEQIKKMNKIKTKLNNELKDEIKNREEQKFDTVGHRIALDKKKRVYPDNDKIKKFLIEQKKKISDYYKESEFYTLSVTKIETVLKMEKVDDV